MSDGVDMNRIICGFVFVSFILYDWMIQWHVLFKFGVFLHFRKVSRGCWGQRGPLNRVGRRVLWYLAVPLWLRKVRMRSRRISFRLSYSMELRVVSYLARFGFTIREFFSMRFR